MSVRALAATTILAVLALPTQAAPIVTNGSFSQYTTSLTTGFLIDRNGTLTGWSNTSTNRWYNFLFRSDVAGSTANALGVNNGNAVIRLYDRTNCGTSCSGNTWDGRGPVNPAGGYFNFLAMDGNFPGNTGPVTQTLTGLTVGTVYAVSFTYAFAQQFSFNGTTNQNLIVGFGNNSQRVLASNYALSNHGFSGWQQATLYFSAASASQALSFLAFGVETLPPFALLANVSIVAAPEPATLALIGTGLLATIAAARTRRARRQKALA